MSHVILLFAACPALPYFCALSKRERFSGGGGFIEQKIGFDLLRKFCQKHFSFSFGFRNTQVPIAIKICPVTAKLCAEGQAERQTDTTKLTDAFRNFANAPKIWRNTSNILCF